jgi:CBS domain containing-hemolysin-like protein
MPEHFVAFLIAIGLIVFVVTSIGGKVLRDFSHRQLLTYCRAVRRRELFEEIIGLHDDVAMTCEKLQMTALVLLIGYAAYLCADLFDSRGPLLIVPLVLVALLLVLAITVWVPWAVARHSSAAFLLRTWWVWRFVHRAFTPFNFGAKLFDSLFRRLAGRPKIADKEQEEEEFEDEIMTMVDVGKQEGLLDEEAREMIEGVIELGDDDVADIMTQRRDVDALEVDMDWPDVIAYVNDCGRTRLPVYERNLDNIVGVLYVKDLLPELVKQPGQRRRTLRELVRDPWLIPSTIPLDDLLQDFRENRKHLAIVVDEYEAVEGVVTIEDVLEEIVGEIVDESDKQEEDEGIRQLGETQWEAHGSVHVDTINERLGLNLPESHDFETIGGFVTSRLGRFPKTGESVECDGVRITVRDVQPRFVQKVLLDIMTPSPTGIAEPQS